MSDHPKLILFVRDVCEGEQYELTENSLSEFYVTPETHNSTLSKKNLTFIFVLIVFLFVSSWWKTQRSDANSGWDRAQGT